MGKWTKQLEEVVTKNKAKIIVLDDDPTGVQTVHDVSVYTDWNVENIRKGFLEQEKIFFILTNSNLIRYFKSSSTVRLETFTLFAISSEVCKKEIFKFESISIIRFCLGVRSKPSF